jgi:hypothetical protein
MSYHADKPFGRRKTDKAVSVEESRHWQRIRRDVDEDSTGIIRRYLRLSKRILDVGNGNGEAGDRQTAEITPIKKRADRRVA